MAKQRTTEELLAYQKTLDEWSGVFLVDKPLGISSRQVDSVIKRLIGFKKVGHIGTLDPFATGLLQVCVGRSTAIVPYLENLEKTYKVFVHLGLKTDTLDSQGQVVAWNEKAEARLQALSQAPYTELLAALEKLKAEKEQIPPLFSAIKVNGKALYDYARQGQSIDLTEKKRKIEIYQADLKSVKWIAPKANSVLDLQKQEFFKAYFKAEDEIPVIVHESIEQYMQNAPVLELEIDFTVSKGTYIRSLAERLGELLGLEAYAARLSREQIGDVTRADTYLLSDLMNKSAEELKLILKRPEQCLSYLPRLDLPKEEAIALVEGKHRLIYRLKLNAEFKQQLKESKHLWAVFFEETFVGLVKVENGKLVPERIFWQK